MIKEAWEEYTLIDWGQILFGMINSKWGEAQGMFYGNNPDTKHKKYLTREVCVSKIIDSLCHLYLVYEKIDMIHFMVQMRKKREKCGNYKLGGRLQISMLYKI